jgi:predicted ATPase
MSHNAPLLLFIEDLQWANSSTLNLFGFLSMRLQHLPVLLVGTVQHAEAIPALQRLLTLGRRRGGLRLLSLSPLTQNAVADLLRASDANESVIETLAEWLNAKSGGNPFLLSEILAQLRAEKILTTVNDGWLLDTAQWLRWRTTFSSQISRLRRALCWMFWRLLLSRCLTGFCATSLASGMSRSQP